VIGLPETFRGCVDVDPYVLFHGVSGLFRAAERKPRACSSPDLRDGDLLNTVVEVSFSLCEDLSVARDFSHPLRLSMQVSGTVRAGERAWPGSIRTEAPRLPQKGRALGDTGVASRGPT